MQTESKMDNFLLFQLIKKTVILLISVKQETLFLSVFYDALYMGALIIISFSLHTTIRVKNFLFKMNNLTNKLLFNLRFFISCSKIRQQVIY